MEKGANINNEKREMRPRHIGISPEETINNYCTLGTKIKLILTGEPTFYLCRIVGIDQFNYLVQLSDKSLVFLPKHGVKSISAVNGDK
jgi:hypothetical protein